MFVILAISDGDKHFSEAILEYKKRLGNTLRIVFIKPSKEKNPTLAIRKDTENLLQALNKKQYTGYQRIMLSKDGSMHTTESFADVLRNQKTVLCIGGPYGMDESLLAPYINQCICFGSMTMPHGLVQLVLAEQLYRVTTLRSGKKYHY